MAKHKDRMRDIGVFANPFLQAIAEADMQHLKDDPAHKAFLKKNWKRTTSVLMAQSMNGGGFEVDETLRYFLADYNNRNFQYGLTSMPCSFNVMEAFFEHRPELAFFRLRDEKDFIFSMAEFVDFATSPGEDHDISQLTSTMEEGVIYSYTICDKLEDFTFSFKDQEEYAISGVSLIRHGSEIDMMIVAGQKADIAEATKEISQTEEDVKIPESRKKIKPDPSLKREAVPLSGIEGFWKILALTRFDLADSTQDVRYILKDCGNNFLVISDDIHMYTNEFCKLTPDSQKLFIETREKLKPYGVLFEVSKTLLLLPVYFFKFGGLVSIEQHPTKLLSDINKLWWLGRKKLLGPKELILRRSVSILNKRNVCLPDTVLYINTGVKIETTGYWKKLPPDKVGKDKEGRDIHGRTWVQQNLSWAERDTYSDAVMATNVTQAETFSGPNAGFLYIMRSASDRKDIYKIGLTRRSPEARAGELSSKTGVPTKYLVVEDWEVADCVLAEKLIHEELEQYRINDRREFFLAPYKLLRSVVDRTVDTVNTQVD